MPCTAAIPDSRPLLGRAEHADADAPALGLSPLWHWLRVPSVCVLVAEAHINRVPEQRYAEILRKVADGRGLQLSCAVLVP